MMEEPEKDRLDQSLREKFEQFRIPPAPPVWAGVAPHITRPPQPALRKRRRPVPLPWLFVLTGLLAGLGGWLLPHGAARPMAVRTHTSAETTAANAATTARQKTLINSKVVEANVNSTKSSSGLASLNSGMVSQNPGLANRSTGLANLSSGMVSRNPGTANRNSGMPNRNPGLPNRSSGTANPGSILPNQNAGLANPTSKYLAEILPVTTAATVALSQPGMTAGSLTTAGAVDSMPATLRPLAALERQTLVQLPSVATLAPGTLPADSRTALLVNLRRERAELFRLQRRTDSLLLALGDLPGAPLAAPVVAAIPPADTARPQPLKHRWSLLLSATPEQNTLTLQGPETDSLTALRRNHETGRAGVNASVMAEYQLTKRLSIGGGVGYMSFGADSRITNKTIDVIVRNDTITTRSTSVYTSVNQTHSIRIIQVPQLSPVFNGSGQVIRYDTVYVPRQDTVYSTIVQHDTTHTTNHTITPNITKKETTTTRLLQPTYRFFTVPVLLRYRLSLGPGRWWADVAGGAQFQFFLGGTQVVTQDGVNFRTESITAGNGPFRSLNVALSGSLALNYALTNRLSVSVAPSMRWQALSLYKPETGLRQQPTATGLMFGIRFGL
jgi:hypothetical protein